ncbi:hypothetical protein HDU82_000660 [Entophlyctis luteolus]|nr:hypothetical protein HDU82_000660 [Entophlyctis luteolus]
MAGIYAKLSPFADLRVEWKLEISLLHSAMLFAFGDANKALETALSLLKFAKAVRRNRFCLSVLLFVANLHMISGSLYSAFSHILTVIALAREYTDQQMIRNGNLALAGFFLETGFIDRVEVLMAAISCEILSYGNAKEKGAMHLTVAETMRHSKKSHPPVPVDDVVAQYDCALAAFRKVDSIADIRRVLRAKALYLGSKGPAHVVARDSAAAEFRRMDVLVGKRVVGALWWE